MELTNEELIKLWAVKATILGVIVTFGTALISLYFNYKNSQKIEKYKKAFEWQKDYFSNKLNSYMTSIDNLYTSLKSVRELIEELTI